MNLEIQKLREEIDRISIQLESQKSELNSLIASCKHGWGLTEYDPIVRDRDPMSTWTAITGQSVTRTDIPRWKRTCLHCGTVEETFRSKKTVTIEPNFGPDEPVVGFPYILNDEH